MIAFDSAIFNRMSDNDDNIKEHNTRSNNDDGFPSAHTSKTSNSTPSGKKRKASDSKPKDTPMTYTSSKLTNKMSDFYKEAKEAFNK